MDTHYIFIYFSEKMIENFTISSVKLQNAEQSPTEELQLTGTPQGLTFFDHTPFHQEGTSFSAKLSSDDIDRLKTSSLLTPLSLQSLFLWAPLGLARSSSASTVLPHMNSTETIFAVPITEFLPDLTGPVITQATLDLDAGRLQIVFDEPVHGAALRVDKIALLSDAYGNSISLTSLGDALSPMNTSSLTINLTTADLNAVKHSYAYGTLDKMRVQVDFIPDIFGNVLLGDADLDYKELIVPIDFFIPDTTPPELLSFSIDLSSDTIHIVFDELVEHWSINPMHIQLLSAANTSDPATEYLQLSNYSVVLGDRNSRESNITVDLGLLRADAFRLQAELLIGQNDTTTFLHISGVSDISGNQRMSNTSVIRVTEIRSDTSSPELESFDFDLGGTTATVTLYFSEVMDINSFDCAEFKFASEQAEVPVETVTLITADCVVSTTVDSRVVSFTVAATKFSSGSIGSAATSTFAYAPTPSISSDPAGNVLRALDAYSAKMVGPQVVGFILDVSGNGNGTVDVIFSKDVDRASFIGNKIGFYSPATDEQFLLEGDVHSYGFLDSSPVVDFIFTVDISMHNLIRLKDIRIEGGDMLLLVNASCATDTGGIDVAIARRRDNKVASKFVRDFSKPVILSMSIDMSINYVVMELNEPIDTPSLRVDKLTLQSAAGALTDDSIYSHQFTGGTIESAFKDASVLYTIMLSNEDFGSIKLMAPNLASSLANTFLSIDFSAFADVSGNMHPTVDPLSALPFNDFVGDTLDPVVEYFTLDMDKALLTLMCSEPMRAETVNVSHIVLQSRYFGGLKYGTDLQYRLSADSSYVTSGDGFSISIQIGDVDKFNIRNTPNLVRKQISTYLILSADTATDLAGNKITEIIDGEAYRAHVYLPDVTPPVVEQIVVDFSSDTIAFHFSETVWTQTADIRALRIQSDARNDLQLFHDFQAASNELSNADEPFSTYVSFKISLFDLNAIKWRTPLGASRDTAFFAWSGSLVTDVFSNQVVASSNLSATIATTYLADRTPPVLLAYYLNMNTLVLNMEFSESIYLPLAHLEQGILQSTFVKRFGNHVNLSFSLASSGSDLQSNLLDIHIDNRTSDIMKYYGIAKTQNTSFLTYGSEFVADGFRNFISPLWDGSVQGFSPRLPDLYVKDTTKPALSRWFVDYEQSRLFLIFTEPVFLMDCSAISFEFSSGFNFSLRECTTEYTDYGTTVVYHLLDDGCGVPSGAHVTDTTEVCSTYQLSYSEHSSELVTAKLLQQHTGIDTAYLSIAEGALADYAEIPNYSREIVFVAALGPDCSPCAGGTYLTAPCTASTDRVCGACKACGVREWMVGECTPVQDTQCQACSDCRYGSFISEACSAAADTQCSDCTRCVELEVEIRECVRGLDAICDSCRRCSFEDDALQDIRAACEVSEKYYHWINENCCRTSFKEEFVSAHYHPVTAGCCCCCCCCCCMTD